MAREFALRDEIVVHTPIERCFLLSTSVEIVECELKMRPVRGRTSGLVTGGDTVRWEGWRLGLPQVHESLIEQFDPPVYFRDRMIAGRFARFEHGHAFRDLGSGNVLMQDEVRFTMPWGWPGDLIGQWVLAADIRGLLKRRFARLKRIAESEEWRKYLPEKTGHAHPLDEQG
jgi:ligand-binding SRPBCC domain-containing protein